MAHGGELLHHPDIPLPARQLAAALLAVEPSFSAETYTKRKSARTAAVELLLRSNNMLNTIYQSGKSIEA